jgi:GNAT superfamily N-acetyltransferase
MNIRMQPSRVRPARAEDAAEIARLYAVLVSNPLVNVLPDRIAALASDRNARVFVFDEGQRITGTALVALCADVMFGVQPFAVVENIVVDESARRTGIGSHLLRAVEIFCAEADCSKIMLLSSAGRSQAHFFFERCGYAGSVKRGFVKYRKSFG